MEGPEFQTKATIDTMKKIILPPRESNVDSSSLRLIAQELLTSEDENCSLGMN